MDINMLRMFSLLLVLKSAIGIPVNTSCICPNYHPSMSKCFLPSGNYMNCHEAHKHCRNMGGALATIDDGYVQDLLNNSIPNFLTSTLYWIDVTDRRQEGIWTTWDGHNISWTSWADEEPNNKDRVDNKYYSNCVVLEMELGKWYDESCSGTPTDIQARALCEKYSDGSYQYENYTVYQITNRANTFCGREDSAYYQPLGKCYWRNHDYSDAIEAQMYCTASGGRLANLESPNVTAFIHDNVMNGAEGKNFWIGAHDKNQDGVWTTWDGTTLTWQNWRPEEPDGDDCIFAGTSTGTWIDRPCTSSASESLTLCEQYVGMSTQSDTTSTTPDVTIENGMPSSNVQTELPLNTQLNTTALLNDTSVGMSTQSDTTTTTPDVTTENWTPSSSVQTELLQNIQLNTTALFNDTSAGVSGTAGITTQSSGITSSDDPQSSDFNTEFTEEIMGLNTTALFRNVTNASEFSQILVYQSTQVSSRSTARGPLRYLSSCRRFSKMPTSNLESKIKIISQRIHIDKQNTTRTRRRFVSSSDNRPSAITSGTIAVTFITLVICFIVFLDLVSLKSNSQRFSRKSKRRRRHKLTRREKRGEWLTNA